MKRAFFVRVAGMLLLFGSAASQTRLLDVPEVSQEQNQWCWAGVSAAVIRAAGTPVDQCAIAEYARVRATWHDFGSVDCCVDPSQGCNYWNYNWGVDGSIQDILSHWGISSHGHAAPLPLPTAVMEIDAERPFIIRWGWSGGGGHFLVGYGYDDSLFYYMDPWPGEGAKIADYAWVVAGGSHTWTQTNLLTTPLAVRFGTFRVTWTTEATVQLMWITLSETANYGFEVQRGDSTGTHFTTLPDGFVEGYGTTLIPRHYSFVDRAPLRGRASYRLRQIDFDGSEHFSDVVTVAGPAAVPGEFVPARFALQQNHPNPFNPRTTIPFELAERAVVRISVHDLLGREVAVLVDEPRDPGAHKVGFDGRGLSSGMYMYRMQAGPFVDAKTLVLVR